MLKALFTLIWVLIAYILGNMGMDWISLGYGLHPAIAMPAAILSLTIAIYGHLPSLSKEHHHDPIRSCTRYHHPLGE